MWYAATGKTAKRLKVKDRQWHVALYEGVDPDAIDEPQEPTDDRIATLTEAFMEHDADRSVNYAKQYLALDMLREVFVEDYGKRDG